VGLVVAGVELVVAGVELVVEGVELVVEAPAAGAAEGVTVTALHVPTSFRPWPFASPGWSCAKV
jgi:hypothetical protein